MIEYDPNIRNEEFAPIVGYRQIEIVPTSRHQYITGLYALNIPDEHGDTSDWHSSVFWVPRASRHPKLNKVSLGGKGDFDTNHIYNDMGVKEARDRLIGIGLYVPNDIKEVYVADSVRAVLDLLYFELTNYHEARLVKGACNDWITSEAKKNTLLIQAKKLTDAFTGHQLEELNNWISREST